jgi:hypothetical protein
MSYSDGEESADLEAECIEQNPKSAEASKQQQQRSLTPAGTRRPEKESTTPAVLTPRRSLMRRQFSMSAILPTLKTPLYDKMTTQAVPIPRRSMMTRQLSMPALHATSKNPLSYKVDGGFTMMNASGHFEAHWDVLPSIRRRTRSNEGRRKRPGTGSSSKSPNHSATRGVDKTIDAEDKNTTEIVKTPSRRSKSLHGPSPGSTRRGQRSVDSSEKSKQRRSLKSKSDGKSDGGELDNMNTFVSDMSTSISMVSDKEGGFSENKQDISPKARRRLRRQAPRAQSFHASLNDSSLVLTF